ncbi:MAG: Na+/H+ antiporter NhaC family protein [Coriobacteriia bacterium]|nr:Na+/H+ antiporter NhaC family protein [Coriobacteriia bacterium]
MHETATLLLFAAALIVCVILGKPILLGLAAGLMIFCAYALWKVRKPLEVLKMMLDGVKTAKGVLIIFMFIGILTGLWRASGTISALVMLATGFFTPATLALLTFVSCSAVSFLIGTSFGTAATMGVVCATIGQSAGVDPALMGGAVLSGCYFGDRCSPVSSSAFLVAELTGTTVRQNIPRMLKSALVPTLACVALYLILGATEAADGTELNSDAAAIALGFNLHPAVYLPAFIVLALPLVCRNARLTLFVSSAIAFGLCVFVQNESPLATAQALLMGFDAAGKSALLQGGGVASMVYPGAVVCMSSAYAGIFHGTGLLRGIQNQLDGLSQHITKFGACLASAVATSCIACNQTLAIMLTNQLCGPLQKDKQAFAIELEDTAVLIAAAIPWSIASLVVLQVCGEAPTQSIAFAFFLFLVPLWHLGRDVVSAWRQKRIEKQRTPLRM